MISRLSGSKVLLRAFCTASAVLFAFSVPVNVFAQDSGISSTSATSQTEEPQPAEVTPPVPVGAVGGMGDINLYPRRIIVDRQQRIASVGLYNRVPAAGEYEITVRDLVMTPEGDLVPLDDPRAKASINRLKPASDMVRWSPRRVRLLGNEAQTVRVMARPKADLPEGEYRSHFTVISVPQDQNDGFSIDDATTGGSSSTEIGVRIRPRFAISIPVIVRVGRTTLEVGMETPSFVGTEVGMAIRMNLVRTGTRSAYGDLMITAEGIEEPIALARGIGIYPEVDSRMVEIVLRPDFDEMLLRPGMKLTATFTDDDVDPGKTLASQTFTVP